MTALPSEKFAIVATIDPDAYAASTSAYGSDWVNTEYFHEYLAVVHVGTLATSATVDAAVVQASSATGASSKAITGKSITQLTEGGTDSDKQALINIRTDELDVANGFSFIRLEMTVGTASADSGGVIWGTEPRFGPANDNDLASVDEIVA
jgi:hypothetical protein